MPAVPSARALTVVHVRRAVALGGALVLAAAGALALASVANAADSGEIGRAHV